MQAILQFEKSRIFINKINPELRSLSIFYILIFKNTFLKVLCYEGCIKGVKKTV